MISKRLSSLSSNKQCFDNVKHDYEAALKRSGYTEGIAYQDPSLMSKKKRTRKRNILWYNPPFCASISTNIGKRFFDLIEKHFPPNHKLRKFINKNTIKLSYCCMPNIGQILKGHNKVVLADRTNKHVEDERMYNCRNKKDCPLKGKCLSKSVVYMATVNPEKGEKFNYKGLTDDEFKNRYNDHHKRFRKPRYRKSTELSKAIWDLKDKNIRYTIDWKIITRAESYKSGSRSCNLCLTEKLCILQKPNSINKRTELISKCRHMNKFLIKFCV